MCAAVVEAEWVDPILDDMAPHVDFVRGLDEQREKRGVEIEEVDEEPERHEKRARTVEQTVKTG